jgi:ArsR family transcriptional regulator, virulence genes transcriptional regulator
MDMLSVLGNVTRLRLITCLSQGEKNVTQLVKRCSLSQSSISQHLEKLRRAGLVKTRRRGKEVYYYLVHKEVSEISSNLQAFINKFSN